GVSELRRGAAEHTDHRHRRLLCLRRERPHRRRAADERDELAAFHCPTPPVLPTERIPHSAMAGDYCAAGVRSGLCQLRVKSGKARKEQMLSALARKADIASLPRYVRSVPQADTCSAAKGSAIRSPRRRATAAQARSSYRVRLQS